MDLKELSVIYIDRETCYRCNWRQFAKINTPSTQIKNRMSEEIVCISNSLVGVNFKKSNKRNGWENGLDLIASLPLSEKFHKFEKSELQDDFVSNIVMHSMKFKKGFSAVCGIAGGYVEGSLRTLNIKQRMHFKKLRLIYINQETLFHSHRCNWRPWCVFLLN